MDGPFQFGDTREIGQVGQFIRVEMFQILQTQFAQIVWRVRTGVQVNQVEQGFFRRGDECLLSAAKIYLPITAQEFGLDVAKFKNMP